MPKLKILRIIFDSSISLNQIWANLVTHSFKYIQNYSFDHLQHCQDTFIFSLDYNSNNFIAYFLFLSLSFTIYYQYEEKQYQVPFIYFYVTMQSKKPTFINWSTAPVCSLSPLFLSDLISYHSSPQPLGFTHTDLLTDSWTCHVHSYSRAV